MINDTTDHLKLPLPYKDNYLEDDVPRLREALFGMDNYARVTDAGMQALRSEKADSATMQEALSQKADSATMLAALAKKADKGELVKLNNTVTNTSTIEAATANAVKVAYDRGTAGVNAAAAAHGAANAAQTTANRAKNITNLVRTAPAAWCVPQAGADGKINAGWITYVRGLAESPSPTPVEAALAVEDMRADDPEGLTYVRGLADSRRAELLAAVEAAVTLEEVEAIVVSYPV